MQPSECSVKKKGGFHLHCWTVQVKAAFLAIQTLFNRAEA